MTHQRFTAPRFAKLLYTNRAINLIHTFMWVIMPRTTVVVMCMNFEVVSLILAVTSLNCIN
jgi:hypothetical protein